MHKIIIILCITTCVLAKERIKIAKILDNNHYLTTKGDTISPAYVHCIERNPQTTEWNWLAEETHDYLQDSFRTFKIFIKEDSLLSKNQVHIYRRLPLGRESLNYNLLRNGYGKLEHPEKAPVLYVEAAQEAERKYIGIHKKKNPKFTSHYENAVWLTVGSGGGIGLSDYWVGPINPPLQSGLTFRHQKFAINIGYDAFGNLKKQYLGTLKLGLGLASHRQGAEVNFVIGPTLYTSEKTKTYLTKNAYKTKKITNYHVGLYLKAQTFAYFFRCVGGGLSLTTLLYSDLYIFSISFDLGAGFWFHPKK